MVETTRTGSICLLAPEFDAFLFAPIGEQGNGMLLSVVSALARLDLDPWQEAANLARLPRKAATERLSSFIASLPGGPSTFRDPGTIAARLIALLPRQAIPHVPSVETLFSRGKATSSPTNRYVIVYMILMAFAVGAQWIAANRQSQADLGGVHTSAPNKLPQPAPPNSGQ